MSLCVDPAGIISGHSLITCSLPSTRRDTSAPTRVVRAWCKIDRSAFLQAIRDSSLSCTPSSLRTAEELFAEYDTVLRSITDQLAPAHQVRSRVRPHAPWFDAECRATRRDCRKLERLTQLTTPKEKSGLQEERSYKSLYKSPILQ